MPLPKNRGDFVSGLVLVAVLAVFVPAPLAAEGDSPKVAIQVEGTGFLRDRELQFALHRLLDAGSKATLDTNAIEDAAVILSSSLVDEGFQKPQIAIEVTQVDGSGRKMNFDPTFANPLPRAIEAREVRFKLTPGVRYHIAAVALTGSTVLSAKQVKEFFRSDATLLATRRGNAYSPSRVTSAADALLYELRQRGHVEAEVRTAISADEVTGAVTVQVVVKEGPRWDVGSVHYEENGASRIALPAVEPWIGRPWSPTLQEDIREAIRQAHYLEGLPDVKVQVSGKGGETVDGRIKVAVLAQIAPGAQVSVGELHFRGRTATQEHVLRRRVPVKSGEPLNIVFLERARYRISRLGVFDSVDLRFEPPTGPVRDAVFVVRESPPFETSLLLGYASYEQLRAGVEHRQLNIFGRAHQSRLEFVQSMKSTSGDGSYTVPELFGESLDGTARLYGLQRREIAFVRQEFGLSLSLRRALRGTGGDATAGYTLESLRNRSSSLSTQATDDRQVIVTSINLSLTGDRRDSPLRPRRGYHWSARVEGADPILGGEATFQRVEIGGAYHTPWGGGRWVHLAFSHGVVTTLGSTDATLPVNKRFFPGGDNSIRGYKRGAAAPRGANGLFVGAKAQVLVNIELEQALTANWSIVLFGDASGTAVSLRDYPFDERLYSVGLGVRYQTLIGPVRVEYGRNVTPRQGDPTGTLQISIGYPF